MQQDDVLAIRRELKALDILGGLRYLLPVCSVGVHRPDLSTSEEGYLALIPGWISLTLIARRERGVACTVSIDDRNLLLTLIGLHTIIAYLINYLFAVGTGPCGSDTPHSPKSLWGHQVAVKFDILFAYHVVISIYAAR